MNTAFLPLPDESLVSSFFQLSRFEFDLDKSLFFFDAAFGKLLDLAPLPFLTEKEMLNLMPPGDQEHFKMFLQPIKDGHTLQIKKDLRLVAADGALRWFEISARLRQNDGLHSNRILEGIFVDISERRKSVANLSESEGWFREVLEESPHAMYRVDYRKNRFDYISKGFARALNCTREEILNTPYTEFMTSIHPEDMKIMTHELDRLFTDSNGQQFTYYCEFRYQLKNGSYVWLDDTFTVVPGPDGQYSYQVGFGSVIEKRKNLEEQLRQTNEMLEGKISERTAELHKANLNLKNLMVERRELEKRLIEISERERRFFGRELHDGLCQQIVGVQCMFEALRNRLSICAPVEASELKVIRDFMHDAVLQLRSLSRGLCPMSLSPEAIGAALVTLATQTSILYKIDCRFNGSQAARIKNPDAALHVYRISQEAVQNAIRHGQAKKVTITIKENKDFIDMCVENDGRPFAVSCAPGAAAAVKDPGSGLGLRLIDYRVGLLGGNWQIENLQNKVRLSIQVPVCEGLSQ